MKKYQKAVPVGRQGFAPILILGAVVIAGVVLFLISKNFGVKNLNLTVNSSPVPTSTPIDTKVWKTYSDQDLGYSFKYDIGLLPYELSNGVVMFLEEPYYSDCKEYLRTKNTNLSESCSGGKFSMNGSMFISKEQYESEAAEKVPSEVYTPQTYMDSEGRTWKTFQSLGEVFNFEAYTSSRNGFFTIAFQQKEDNREFFNQILSTVKFTK